MLLIFGIVLGAFHYKNVNIREFAIAFAVISKGLERNPVKTSCTHETPSLLPLFKYNTVLVGSDVRDLLSPGVSTFDNRAIPYSLLPCLEGSAAKRGKYVRSEVDL